MINVIISNYADMKKGHFKTQEEGKEIQNLQVDAEGPMVYTQYTKGGRKVRTKLSELEIQWECPENFNLANNLNHLWKTALEHEPSEQILQ